jgi:phosphotransacetylase
MSACRKERLEGLPMPLPGFDELTARADARASRLPLAVAGAADLTVLRALRRATDAGWVAPILAGRSADVQRLAAEHGIDLGGTRLVDSDDPAGAAVAEVAAGRARLLMKGQVATPALLRALLAPAAGLRTGRVVCQVVLLELPRAGRRFLLADTGIVPRPTLEQKADILTSAVAVARGLGQEAPRVAALSASESVTEALPDTIEAAELQRRNEAGEWPGCAVQGPLSFDLAFAADAAAKKRVPGPVPGAADVLLFPDLTAANLTVKAIMYTADCSFGGVLCGAACPVVFMSRADSTETRVRSLALALRLAGKEDRG